MDLFYGLFTVDLEEAIIRVLSEIFNRWYDVLVEPVETLVDF